MSAIAATNSEGLPAVEDSTQLNILSKLKSIDQINKQRRIFLDGTITEEGTMGNVTKDEEELENNLKELEKKSEVVQKPIQEPLESPGRVLLEDKGEEKSATNPEIGQPNEVMLQTASTKSLNVKYATLPSPNTVTLRSPVLPPPKPPMLSRTRSIGSADGKSPVSPTNSLFRQSFPAGTATSPSQNSPAATSGETPLAISGDETPPATVSARHYEGLIEELRCPGCAGAMKAPILLCKGGHSICEQCTRILLMCPLCKESFTNSRSLTVEALCAKAHFRCGHAAGGCQVRMPVVLLPWHEQQCMYKPMKCFMGRVWGACRWQGREVQWKEHLEQEHADRLFQSSSANLEWNLATRRKPLTGYYVFQAHDEMFNFYEIHDHQRILFTMTCTSNRRDSKYNYAYEVTVIQPENEALSMTQKFPVHSEYDKDILMEGTCVSIPLFELNRFLDQEKVLHYRVSVLAVKSPHRAKPPRQSQPSQPVDLEAAPSGGINGKSVPANMIITRTYKEAIGEVVASQTPTVVASPHAEDDAVSGDNGVPDIERKWGTPQLHFNRKYLRNTLNDTTPLEDELRPLAGDLRNGHGDDKLSLCSNNTSYTKKVSDSLRRSFRALKTDIVQMRPFSKKVVKASVQSNDNQ